MVVGALAGARIDGDGFRRSWQRATVHAKQGERARCDAGAHHEHAQAFGWRRRGRGCRNLAEDGAEADGEEEEEGGEVLASLGEVVDGDDVDDVGEADGHGWRGGGHPRARQ